MLQSPILQNYSKGENNSPILKIVSPILRYKILRFVIWQSLPNRIVQGGGGGKRSFSCEYAKHRLYSFVVIC